MSRRTQKELVELRLANIHKNNTRKGFRWGFSDKTVWDWLNLLSTLLIPLVVVLATIGFGWWQAHLGDLQHQADQQSALDQQQAAILQTYIDNIQDLLLNHNLRGIEIPHNPSDQATYDEVVELARARTMTALRGLDPRRKGILLQFLYEAQLIGYLNLTTHKPSLPIIYLGLPGGHGADLSGTIFESTYMIDVDLSDTNLKGADLRGASFINADMDDVNLNGANLYKVFLLDTSLNAAQLNGANLEEASLDGADLERTKLSNADLSFADLGCFTSSMPDLPLPKMCTNLTGSDITQQQLDQVDLCLGAILPPGIICHHK